MSDDTSARLALPLLAAGQAQKEMTVDEALIRLDMTVQASAAAAGIDTPPAAPVAGQCWIVGDAPLAEWSGQAGALAAWTDGGWRFVVPIEGMTVWIEDDGVVWRRVGGSWRAGDIAGARVLIGGAQVVGAQAAAIAPPAGGAVVDAEARDTVTAILAALNHHGLIAS